MMPALISRARALDSPAQPLSALMTEQTMRIVAFGATLPQGARAPPPQRPCLLPPASILLSAGRRLPRGGHHGQEER